jgi:hypothetical protein
MDGRVVDRVHLVALQVGPRVLFIEASFHKHDTSSCFF